MTRAILGKQHYIALGNMFRCYPHFLNNLWRYVTGSGSYPYEIQIRTPLGLVSPTLYSHHDILTVNEIFCRLDYSADSKVNVVVDLGSNLGISALYFLTRNRTSRCYLFEPNPRNIERLKKNLSAFQHRIKLAEVAVAHFSGVVKFGVESTGRYGGIGIMTSECIQVNCIHINNALDDILRNETIIDILKIDTEGVEENTVRAITADSLRRIRTIYMEAHPRDVLHPDLFSQKQYGSICVLTNRERGSQ